MGWILRTSNDLANPTLPGGVYGKWISAGIPVYYKFDGARTRGILFLCDGGNFGIDSVSSFEYKGQILVEGDDWILHRGTLPAQIVPVEVTAINTGTNVITAAGHGLANGDPFRFGVIDGDVPVPVSRDVKYYAGSVSGANFKALDAPGGTEIDLSTAGTGQVIVWKADTGFDDPEQGLPTFCPETGYTFNNISYIEFKLPENRSSLTEQPDWEDFRASGIGRRIYDYDVDGVEGDVVTDPDLLCNVALQIADNAFYSTLTRPVRFNWASWFKLRNSAHTDIWQRVNPSVDPASPSGFVGRYFDNEDFTNLLVTRDDATINLDLGSGVSPAPGVIGTTYSVIWNGTILPEFSEVYTLTVALLHGTGQLFVNGVLLASGVDADFSTTYNFEADGQYEIEVRYTHASNTARSILKWQSVSQALEIVPADRVIPSDSLVKRYECHIAFAIPTEASEVHERLMDRVPGWDWTDENGEIVFLGPDRPIAFTFAFDKLDDDSSANFEKNTLVKKRRPMIERKNFRLFRFRDVQKTGYPFQFVQSDRPDLRAFTNGEPSNDPALDLGVATRSLAERMGEIQMVMQTDPDHTLDISGGRSSSKIRKAHRVLIYYYDEYGNYVTDRQYLCSFHAWGSGNEKNSFSFIPVPYPFYTDEPYRPSFPAPTLLTLSVDRDTGIVTGNLQLNGGSGDIHVWRKQDAGAYVEIDDFPSTQTTFTDTPGSDGLWTYKVAQDESTGFSNERSIIIDTTSTPPVLSGTAYALGVVSGTITNGGGTGDIEIMRSINSGPFSVIETVGSGVTSFEDTPMISGSYAYKLYQDGTGESNTEVVTVTIVGTAPTDLIANSTEDDFDVFVDLSWTNHSAPGSILIERKQGSAGQWGQLATIASSETAYSDTIPRGSVNRTFYYRVSNLSVPGYSNEVAVSVPRVVL